MPISLITINITKTIYLVCSENRQQRLVDAGCFKFGRQDPDFLLLLILSANEECFLTYSDTILMWEPVPQTCYKHEGTAVEGDARGCLCRAVLNTSFACAQAGQCPRIADFYRAELSTTDCHCSVSRGKPRSFRS